MSDIRNTKYNPISEFLLNPKFRYTEELKLLSAAFINSFITRTSIQYKIKDPISAFIGIMTNAENYTTYINNIPIIRLEENKDNSEYVHLMLYYNEEGGEYKDHIQENDYSSWLKGCVHYFNKLSELRMSIHKSKADVLLYDFLTEIVESPVVSDLLEKHKEHGLIVDIFPYRRNGYYVFIGFGISEYYREKYKECYGGYFCVPETLKDEAYKIKEIFMD